MGKQIIIGGDGGLGDGGGGTAVPPPTTGIPVVLTVRDTSGRILQGELISFSDKVGNLAVGSGTDHVAPNRAVGSRANGPDHVGSSTVGSQGDQVAQGVVPTTTTTGSLGPITIRKRIDSISPVLLSAIVQSQTLPDIRIFSLSDGQTYIYTGITVTETERRLEPEGNKNDEIYSFTAQQVQVIFPTSEVVSYS